MRKVNSRIGSALAEKLNSNRKETSTPSPLTTTIGKTTFLFVSSIRMSWMSAQWMSFGMPLTMESRFQRF